MNRKRVLFVVACVFLCVAVLSVRVLFEGSRALGRGDAAYEAGEVEEAITWWRRSARWYLPLAPHLSHAYDRLETSAKAAEDAGDSRVALLAWRASRAAARATRSFYEPFADREARANDHIAALMAVQLGGESEAVSTNTQIERKRLDEDLRPSTGWALLALFGLFLWVGSGFAMAHRAVDAEDRLVPVAAAYAGAGIALGLLLWLTGLYFA